MVLSSVHLTQIGCASFPPEGLKTCFAALSMTPSPLFDHCFDCNQEVPPLIFKQQKQNKQAAATI
jgi:hypothetical protein